MNENERWTTVDPEHGKHSNAHPKMLRLLGVMTMSGVSSRISKGKDDNFEKIPSEPRQGLSTLLSE